ncbi:13476_t:CDS:2 [Ambispora gerdemannii]|uniref:13476_t:CDS:1 n=1 Tax=Ambispora gerdemannii TaxID=144530 RepID=A0A9N9D4X6_9GLOM|nr:13476_t:CDS:2 [Ambispora gerdemannii]
MRTAVKSHEKVKGHWKPKDDVKLLCWYRKYPNQWQIISEAMGKGRSPKQSRERYMNHLDPRIDHSPLTLAERTDIWLLYFWFGNSWASIASLFPGRTSLQVKNYCMSRLRSIKTRKNFEENTLLPSLDSPTGLLLSSSQIDRMRVNFLLN